MCSVVLGVMAAGLVLGAVGTVQQGQAANNAANFQSQLAKRQAKDARARGAAAEAEQGLATRQLKGRQRAALAGGGVEVDTGSALDITSDTGQFGQLDALTVRNNAEREALRHQAEASLLQSTGQNQLTGSFIGAGSTLLTSAGTVASKWSAFSGGP